LIHDGDDVAIREFLDIKPFGRERMLVGGSLSRISQLPEGMRGRGSALPRKAIAGLASASWRRWQVGSYAFLSVSFVFVGIYFATSIPTQLVAARDAEVASNAIAKLNQYKKARRDQKEDNSLPTVLKMVKAKPEKA
jgi:hypothetical protein